MKLASATGSAVWCGSDAISEADHASLKGLSVTRFIYPLQGAPQEVLNGARVTIEEHHPGDTLWAEQPRLDVATAPERSSPAPKHLHE